MEKIVKDKEFNTDHADIMNKRLFEHRQMRHKPPQNKTRKTRNQQRYSYLIFLG